MHPILWKLPFVDYPIRSYGFMLMIGFFSAAYIAAKRAEKVRANPDVEPNRILAGQWLAIPQPGGGC